MTQDKSPRPIPVYQDGFTLSELLIALAILGIIATFTIPKVLQAQNNAQNNAIAKEVVSMASGAYDAYKLRNTPTASTWLNSLTPYMNYIRYDHLSPVYSFSPTTTGYIFSIQGGAGDHHSLFLANGAYFGYDQDLTFNGTSASDSILFFVDPDGPNSPAETAIFYLYYNGRITSAGGLGGTDPSWFSWSQ